MSLALHEHAVTALDACAVAASAAPCPLCGEREARARFAVEGCASRVVECTACGLARLDPLPADEELARFYPDAYYGDPGIKFRPPVERLVRVLGSRHIRFLARGVVPGGRVLDVGCGRGVLLAELADRGYEVHGVERSEVAALGADPRAQICVAPDLAGAKYPAGFFDAVFIWHVLEHLREPVAAVREVQRILRPGGKLVVAVPNFSSLQARWAGPAWFHLDLPRHVFHFPIRALRRLLEQSGFVCESAPFSSGRTRSDGSEQPEPPASFRATVCIRFCPWRRRAPGVRPGDPAPVSRPGCCACPSARLMFAETVVDREPRCVVARSAGPCCRTHLHDARALLLWALFMLLGLVLRHLSGEFSRRFRLHRDEPYVHALAGQSARAAGSLGEAALTANRATSAHAVEWASSDQHIRLAHRERRSCAGVAMLLVPVHAIAGVGRAAASSARSLLPIRRTSRSWLDLPAEDDPLPRSRNGGPAGASASCSARSASSGPSVQDHVLRSRGALLRVACSEDAGTPPRWGWLAVWALAFALYGGPQLFLFEHLGEVSSLRSPDLGVQVRTMLAIAGRYLVMATTSFGLSTFQHPAPATSWLDPWWLGTLAVGIPLALRAARSLVGARAEGGFWLWAAAGYAPISQLFPFLYPIADRYLYVVLPGLLGVSLLAGGQLADRWGAGGSDASRRMRVYIGVLLACIVLATFAWRLAAGCFAATSA
jgi:SAM-dependent methyltransferase